MKQSQRFVEHDAFSAAKINELKRYFYYKFPLKESGYVTFLLTLLPLVPGSETLIPHTRGRKKTKLLRPWRNVKQFAFYLDDDHHRRLHIDYLPAFEAQEENKKPNWWGWKRSSLGWKDFGYFCTESNQMVHDT